MTICWRYEPVDRAAHAAAPVPGTGPTAAAPVASPTRSTEHVMGCRARHGPGPRRPRRGPPIPSRSPGPTHSANLCVPLPPHLGTT